MSQQRLHILVRELRRVGLEADDAEQFAAELMAHHPLLQKSAGRELRRRLTEFGVDPIAARELVLSLLALELLTHRIPYARVLNELGTHERRIGEARSAAMVGANLLREIHRPRPPKAPAWRRWLGNAGV